MIIATGGGSAQPEQCHALKVTVNPPARSNAYALTHALYN